MKSVVVAARNGGLPKRYVQAKPHFLDVLRHLGNPVLDSWSFFRSSPPSAIDILWPFQTKLEKSSGVDQATDALFAGTSLLSTRPQTTMIRSSAKSVTSFPENLQAHDIHLAWLQIN